MPFWVKSGHMQCKTACPLRANSGHRAAHSMTHEGEHGRWNVKLVALAVLRLITSSYLVGACTGMLWANSGD